ATRPTWPSASRTRSSRSTPTPDTAASSSTTGSSSPQSSSFSKADGATMPTATTTRAGWTMKAYQVSKYKRPMAIGSPPEPTVGDHDVLVEIHAAGVNLLDAKIRDGEFKAFLSYHAPFILGHDLAGVVSRVG